MFLEPLMTSNKHWRCLAVNWGKWGSTGSDKALDSVSDLGKGQAFCPASVSSQVTYCCSMSKKKWKQLENTLTKFTFLYFYNLLHSTLPTWMPQDWVDTSLSLSLSCCLPPSPSLPYALYYLTWRDRQNEFPTHISKHWNTESVLWAELQLESRFLDTWSNIHMSKKGMCKPFVSF